MVVRGRSEQALVDDAKLVRVEASGGSAESLRIDDIRGSKFNLALGGADVASMLLQARKALAIDRPELVVVQSIDHDITATRSATGPSIGLTAAPGRSTAAAAPLVPAPEWS